MLLNSDYDATAFDANLMAFSSTDTLLDDVSFHMSASNFNRRARSSTQRFGGGPMRVTKPSSANNSPRTTMPTARRRTMMNDVNSRRRTGMMDQAAMMASGTGNELSNLSGMEQQSRPMSWHPSTQMPFQPANSTDLYNIQTNLQCFDVPPTPAVYSGYASPASFSPESMTYNYFDQPQYPYDDSAMMSANTFDPSSTMYFPHQVAMSQQDYTDYFTQPEKTDNLGMYYSAEWDNFAMNGFQSTTAPPTPENFLPIQHPEPSLQSDNSIPYHALSDDEPEGEELVGMGLYDAPEKAAPSDPQLDNYRALMMSQYLGAAYQKQEPSRKSLKLEETWNPPASDDEEDGESEEDDETLPQASTTTAVDASAETQELVPQSTPVPNLVHFDNATWI